MALISARLDSADATASMAWNTNPWGVISGTPHGFLQTSKALAGGALQSFPGKHKAL
jgi:hypothetical protein